MVGEGGLPVLWKDAWISGAVATGRGGDGGVNVQRRVYVKLVIGQRVEGEEFTGVQDVVALRILYWLTVCKYFVGGDGYAAKQNSYRRTR